MTFADKYKTIVKKYKLKGGKPILAKISKDQKSVKVYYTKKKRKK